MNVKSTQPAPEPGTGDVWIDVINDALHRGFSEELILAMVRRRQMGKEKYGRFLQYNNGRDALLDCQEEALDLLAYAQQLGDSDVKSKARSVLLELFA